VRRESMKAYEKIIRKKHSPNPCSVTAMGNLFKERKHEKTI